MARSRFRKSHPIVGTTTEKSQPYSVAFDGGRQTYKANDEMKDNELFIADNTRQLRRGRNETRKGLDFYTVPIGEAINVQQTSVTGASTVSVTSVNHFAKKIVATATGAATRVDANIKTDDAVGVLLVTLHEDNAGVPGTEIASSSFVPSEITSTLGYVTAHLMHPATITNTETYWVVFKAQTGSTGTYQISTTTNATTALSSTSSGTTWASTSYDLNVKFYTATAGKVKGLHRVYRPSGANTTFFAHDDDVYKVTDGTGATTAIKTALGAGIDNVRFEFVQDVLYYVTGIGKPRKYVLATDTESEVTTATYNASHIKEHKGVLFYVDTDDKTRLFYSNFAEYDTFTSTDFIYVPSPKSSKGITAIEKLNGALYPFTRSNKYVLLGSDNATFSLDEAPSQKGTFSQESVVADDNFIYHASDDGVYQFDGTSQRNLAEDFLQEYIDILNKDSIVLELFKNRLYIFYTPNGSSENAECFVYNLATNQVESRDTRTYIGRAFARKDEGGLFIQASNHCGALYYAELDSNDHSNLGDIIEYEIGTAFMGFKKPAQRKRITKWRPAFQSQDRNYTISCGYAVDFSSSVSYAYEKSVGGTGVTWDSGATFDSGETYADDQLLQPTDMSVPGAYRRIQLRYKHFAAREPVAVESHTLAVQTQRIR